MTQKELIDQFCEFRGKCTTDDVVALNFAYQTLTPRWISVKEELPKCYKLEMEMLKISDLVVVVTDTKEISVATLNQECDGETGEAKGEPYWFDELKISYGDWINNHVTHWTPLPMTETEKGGEQ